MREDTEHTPGGEAEIPRRDALGLLLGGVLGAFGFARAATAAQGHDQLVGKLADLPPGTARKVRWEDQQVLVLNLDGRVSALSAVCTHQGCIVDWDRDTLLVRCPCHGSVFKPDGSVVEGPAPAPLFSVPVVIRDGQIYLETD